MILLYDTNPEICFEWSKQFKEYLGTQILVKNLPFKDVEFENVVTAGNSYGWMTGGIDLAVRKYYGQGIQDEIQMAILAMQNRMLPVGQSILVKTRDIKKPNLIYAPTMEVPKAIGASEVFYVFAKLLERYESFACCGLGTGTGGVSPETNARAMKEAYKFIRG